MAVVKNKKQLIVLGVILFLLTTAIFAQDRLHQKEEFKVSIPLGKKYDYNNIKVTRVIDGDTFELESGEKVKLIGIDCPEMDTEEGKEAKGFVKDLVEGKAVRLELDVQQKDKYGRLLAYIFIKKDWGKDGHLLAKFPKGFYHMNIGEDSYLFLNATIIGVGYASPMTIPPNVKYADLFQRLYRDAKENKRGLWKEK